MVAQYQHGIQVTSGRPPGDSWFVWSLGVQIDADEAAQGMATIGIQGYQDALDRTANEGQRVLVETLGEEAFINAAHVLANNNYDYDIAAQYLQAETEHPEAIGILLEETATYMAGEFNGATG